MNILPVNRSFYYLTIFFCGLLTTTTLFESVLRFELHQHLFTMDSYLLWFLFQCVVTFITSLFLLRYFIYKQYRYTFYAGCIDLLVVSVFSFVAYNVFNGGMRNYYLPVLVLTLLTGIPYGIGMIAPPTGKRLWLRVAGVAYLSIKLCLAALIAWIITSSHPQRVEITETISNYLTLLASFILVPFIMNFLSELKTQPADVDQPGRAAVQVATGFIFLVAAVIIGAKINTEKYWLSKWVNRGLENAIKLAEPFDARMYTNTKGDTLKYRLLAPLNYDSTKSYPLAVCLHGGGGRGYDNIIQVEGSMSAQFLSTQSSREKYPAFIFVPQCAPTESWGGGLPLVSAVDTIVFDAISNLEEEFNIDTKRIYVMGESLGGYGSWHFITARPDMFAAAVPICGGGNPALASRITDVPVWAFHGAKDRNVPVSESRGIIDAMKKAGGNPRYTEYPDKAHNIGEEVKATPGLLDWVFEQRRE